MKRKRLLNFFLYCLASLALALTFTAHVSAAPKYTILHGFTGGKDGGGLWGCLAEDAEGNLYGSTVETVFKLVRHTNGKWGLEILHNFSSKDGVGNAGLVLDPADNVYGGTIVGGPFANGALFELSFRSRGWKETMLNDFPPGERAGGPHDRLIMDGGGNLYGTGGAAYELSRTGTGWTFSNLHEFPSFNGDGVDPYAGLVMDTFGNLYGTTAHGGSINTCGGGCGMAYELSPTSDGKWKETILHNFGSAGDGVFPGLGALVIDHAGTIYGTTDIGGRLGYGTVFKLTPGSGGHWTETILHNFTSGAGGDHASAGVVMDKAGNLYGTTIGGGSGCDCGVVYTLAPQKNGKWKYTVLHTFVGSDGAQPDANLILDDKGNLYGTTATGGPGGYGVAFELTP